MRRSAMPANPANENVDSIGAGIDDTFVDLKLPRLNVTCDVQSEHDIGLWESLVQPINQHRRGAAEDFFGRLEYHDDRATPFRFHRNELPRRADKARHVYVVTAGMHHAGLLPVGADCLRLRGVRQTVALDDGQTVHVGAQHHHGTLAVADHADDTVATDTARHFDAGDRPQLLHDPGAGLLLLERQLGVGVQMLKERLQVGGVIGGCSGRDRSRL